MNLFLASLSRAYRGKWLFVINGESNSGGYALNSEALPSELLPRPAVQILDNTGLASFLTLDIGTNNLVDHAGLSNGSTHGFELELANRAETKSVYNAPVYLVKTGQGGSTIAQWGVGDTYYTKFLARVTAAQDLLVGEDYRTVILFSLGINDAIAGTNVNTWKTGILAHFENMRDALGADTPIIMTQFQNMGSSPSTYDTYTAMIATICEEVPHTYCVDVSGAGMRDTNHWNYSGMKLVAGRLLDVAETL